jgi:hypothetical protein
MKKLADFENEEEAIINEFVKILKDRGYQADSYYNLESSMVVAIHNLEDEDGEKNMAFATFDIILE